MAFDGITICSIVNELNDKILGGRIDKVYQPENDEIILGIRSFGESYRLLLTANPSHPRLQLTDKVKENPLNPPLFCMVLRKHIQSGKIIEISQPEFERIIHIKIEALNEMGDYATKTLILEVMGRHSNLILIDENNVILECARHISFDKSSVRQVLPGKEYINPPAQGKINPIFLDRNNFDKALANMENDKAFALIYKSYTGISPIIADEICFNAGIDGTIPIGMLSDNQKKELYNSFQNIVKKIQNKDFLPIVYSDENGRIIDFTPFPINIFGKLQSHHFSTVSEMIEYYYSTRDAVYRINQKTADLRHLITQNIERCVKKKSIQKKTLADIENREYLKLCGELITANIYAINQGMEKVSLNNFYSENFEEIEIKLDKNLTPAENAQKYFKKYNKAKRTFIALQEQIKTNDMELEYLEGVLTSVSNCENETDIKEIRRELREQGYLKKEKQQKGKNKVSQKKSAPLHFISDDGFDIFVGKNNVQNDELTLKTARGSDIWFHTKNIPGSHVIVISKGEAVPDTTLTQAAMLAAYYSKGQDSSMVPVDYTQKRNVHKPNGAKPGFVIYDTNKTAYVTPSKDVINNIKRK